MLVVFVKVAVSVMLLVEIHGEWGVLLVVELPIHLEEGLQGRKDTYSSKNCMLIKNLYF